MSRTAASLVLAAGMIGLAVYFLVVPPPGFDGTLVHQIAMPFVLFACAFNIVEGVRTRAHLAQLVGALRMLTGRGAKVPTPQVKVEAIEILLQALRNGSPSVRQTTLGQLRSLTGQGFDDDVERWEEWFRSNRERILNARP